MVCACTMRNFPKSLFGRLISPYRPLDITRGFAVLQCSSINNYLTLNDPVGMKLITRQAGYGGPLWISKSRYSNEPTRVEKIVREKKEVKLEDWTNPYTQEKVTENDPLVQHLFRGLLNKERAALAKSITLVESVHPQKRAQAQVLLSLVLGHTKKLNRHKVKQSISFRIGESHC